MKLRNIRVMLASEHSEMRSLLKDVVETEDRAVVVGEAENAVRALAMARSLRPDVVIIDSHLPYTVGLDTVTLSRMGGLDAAQTISDEIPNVRVVVLNSAGDQVEMANQHGAFFCREATGGWVPFTLHELRLETAAARRLVFASMVAKTVTSRRRLLRVLSDKALLFGALGILGGGVLIISVLFSGAGVFLALAGAVTLLAGVVGRLVSRIWMWR